MIRRLTIMKRFGGLGLIVALACLAACDRAGAGAPAGSASTQPVSAASPSASSAPSDKLTDAGEAVGSRDALGADELSRLFRELSEPDSYFFSDNYISNETSYLQVATGLGRRATKHGAYIGVGPEQNFTYIALTEPRLAFIVDIRRGNAIEQFLYKAAFDGAESRAHFLATLLGRDWQKEGDPGPEGSVSAVLAHAERQPQDEATFKRIHDALEQRITSDYRIALSAADRKTLLDTHRAFFDKGLGLRFELKEQNGRKYPSLRDLFEQKSPEGEIAGYLGSEQSFRIIQRMQRENRIVPVVGDFSGSHALAQIAEELRRRDLTVSVFYTSNVEQYLMEPDKWKAWVKNVEALPTTTESLFLRCYLDQGKKHPQQMAGHRTASVLQSYAEFLSRQKSRGFGSFYQLATHQVLGVGDAG